MLRFRSVPKLFALQVRNVPATPKPIPHFLSALPLYGLRANYGQGVHRKLLDGPSYIIKIHTS